jgi:hypothetical protein
MARDAAGVSRRDFTKRAAAGSVAAAGLVWVAPKISTIKYATKTAAGSRPPTLGTTAVPNVPVQPLGGRISISKQSPCVGDSVRVTAQGFAQLAAVTLELDSAAQPIGMTTADANGAIDVVVTIPKTGPTGTHSLRAVGVKSGGTILTLSSPILIKTEAECVTDPATPVGAAGGPGATRPAATGESGQGGSLPLTGSDAIDLALIGGAAAIGGRVLYGITKHGDDAIDGADT